MPVITSFFDSFGTLFSVLPDLGEFIAVIEVLHENTLGPTYLSLIEIEFRTLVPIHVDADDIFLN